MRPTAWAMADYEDAIRKPLDERSLYELRLCALVNEYLTKEHYGRKDTK